jgi:hypothetical protein
MTAAPKPFRPPVAAYAAPSPEVSLCLHLVDEAQLAGWRVIPEYPNSRFDMLLIAEEWVTTTGASPGMQIGVQAKMAFTKELMTQLQEPLRRSRRWNNPEYLVALVPQVPSTTASKLKQAELERLGIGLFAAYSTFCGNEHPDTVVQKNLTDLSRIGKRHSFPGRVPPPRDDYPFVLPGAVGGQHWSPWKDKAMPFVVWATVNKEFRLPDLRKFKLDPRIWIHHGWIVRTGRREGVQDIYTLNPECTRTRPDLLHPYEFERQLQEYRNGHHQEEVGEAKQEEQEDGRPEGEDRGGDGG